MPNGPTGRPRPPVEQRPEHARRVEPGTHSQSTAPSAATSAGVAVERKAYSSIGENGEGMAALWNLDLPGDGGGGWPLALGRAHGVTQGRQPP